MSAYFGRAVELRVGTALNPQTTVMGVGRSWKELRVEFDIEKSSSKKANTATLKLYNPDPISVSLIQSANMVQLFAGYELSRVMLPLLFTGSIAQRGVRVKKKSKQAVRLDVQETDIVITIEAGDAHLALKSVKFNSTFAPGTDNNTMLAALMTAVGLGMGDGLPSLPPVVYSEQTLLHGTPADVLDQLAGEAGCTWSVQNGNLQILLAGQPAPTTAVLLSPESGLIGTPESTDKGINVRCLLTPSIVPGCIVSVASRLVSGFYKAKVVRHKGDTHGAEWTTEVEAVPVG